MPVHQTRFYETYTSTNGGPWSTTRYEAIGFEPFDSPGHVSTISDDTLAGDLSGVPADTSPGAVTDTFAFFFVEFDLVSATTFDLLARLEVSDDVRLASGLGEARLRLRHFDDAGALRTIWIRVVELPGQLTVVDERLDDLPAGRYRLEASATRLGFFGDLGEPVTLGGSVEFTCVAEPALPFLLATALVVLAACTRITPSARWRCSI